MCQTIAHRSPDDEGIYVHGRAGNEATEHH
jgi:hypothetical protein